MDIDFRSINAYEMPKQLVSLAVQGRLDSKTAAYTAREAMGGDPLLTLAERETMSSHIKKTMNIDSGPVVDTLLEVATNPFVYLAFLPELGAATKLTLGAAKFGPWLRENPTILQALGLTHGLSTFRGTAVTPAVGQIMQSMERNADKSRALLEVPIQRVVARLNQRGIRAKNLAVRALPADDAVVVSRRRMDALLQVRLEGLNKDVVESIPRGVVRGENGTLRFSFAKKERGRLVDLSDGEIDSILDREFDALPLLEALKSDKKRMVSEVFGETNEEIVRNASRIYYASRGVGGSETYKHTNMARRTLQSLFGARTERAIVDGKKLLVPRVNKDGTLVRQNGKVVRDRTEISLTDWQNLVQDFVRTTTTNDFYMPRNMYTTRNSLGEVVPARGSTIDAYGLIPSGSTLPRAGRATPFDEDDLALLQGIQDEVKGRPYRTPGMDLQVKMSKVYDADERREFNLRRRLNTLDSHERYMSSMMTTKALFVDDIADETLELEAMALKAARDEANRQGVNLVPGKLRMTGGGQAHNLDTAFKDISKDLQPFGGYTPADVLDRSYRLMRNDSARDLLREAIIPRIMGEASAKHTATAALLNHSKSMAKWFIESPAGKAMSDVPTVRPIYDGIRNVANSEMRAYGGASFQSNITSYLYGTHLGINFKSVIFNLTQPFVTMMKYGSMNDVVGGYKEALSQLGRYYRDVAETGGKSALSKTQTRELLRKNVRLANVDGIDELGITEDLLGQLDIGIAHNNNVMGSDKLTFLQKLMLPFQQGELVNRVAAGEIALKRVQRQGLDIYAKDAASRSLARSEINQFVQETQFGASLLNTMAAAYGQGRFGFLEAPILRQFLTFPVRMATMPFVTDARLTDRGLLEAARLAGRSVGFSAIAYELLRSDLLGGIDASPYLATAGQTQILSGFVDDRDGPLPIPPAIGIPANLLRGLVTGDKKMASNELYRMIPGGISLGRALKTLDPAGALGLPDELQSTVSPYNRVLWDSPNEDGTIPVLDQGGRLIANQSPRELVLRAAGLDFGKFQNEAEVDNFLVKQRDQMVQYEQAIIQALLNGNQGRVQTLSHEFQKRFGFTPQISRSQVQNAMQNRQVDRTERIVGRIDPLLREAYATQVGVTAPTPNPDLKGEAAVAARALQDMLGATQ